MWEVCHPLPTRCGLHLREENNRHQQCRHHSSTARQQSTHWLSKSYHVTRQGDNAQGTGQGLRGPAKHTLPFLKNTPSGKQFGVSCKTRACLAVWPTHHPCSSHTICLINNNSQSKNRVNTASIGKGARGEKQNPCQTDTNAHTPTPHTPTPPWTYKATLEMLRNTICLN